MLNFLLLLCTGLLASAQIQMPGQGVIISYLGTITGSVGPGPWSAGDNLMINFTLTSGVSANTSTSGGNSVFTWGYTNSTYAAAPLAFSTIQVILKKNQANPPAFNGNFQPTTPSNFNALAVSVTAPSTIALNMNASASGQSQLPTIAGFSINAININQNFGILWPTTVGELTSFFRAVAFNKSTTPSGSPPDVITYFSSSSSGNVYTLYLAPVSLVVTVPVRGATEVPLVFTDMNSFKQALALMGIVFGSWDPTKMNISMSGTLQYGSYTFVLYYALDYELGPIVITLGKFKIKKWGNGVKKGVLGLFSSDDVQAATGFTFTVPSGLIGVLYSVIARFSLSNVVISDGDFNLEITGNVVLKYFRHFKNGESKGKNIGTEEGSISACDSPSTYCFSITIPSTSSVGGYEGSSTSSAITLSKAYTAWALLLPAFLYVLW